jgi:hypothetical protein
VPPGAMVSEWSASPQCWQASEARRGRHTGVPLHGIPRAPINRPPLGR